MSKLEKKSAVQAEHSWNFKSGGDTAYIQLTQNGRQFLVTDSGIVGKDNLSLAFKSKGEGVENLDDSSDIAQCFGHSTSVRVSGITLNFLEIKAPSSEELKAAFDKVKIVSFDAEEI